MADVRDVRWVTTVEYGVMFRDTFWYKCGPGEAMQIYYDSNGRFTPVSRIVMAQDWKPMPVGEAK